MKQYEYKTFKEDTNKLISDVIDYKPTSILAIARGGFILAHAIAEGLDIRDLQSIRAQSYDGTIQRDRLSISANCEYSDGDRVLVVDDISDSGETLRVVLEYLNREFPKVTFKTATLFYKKTSRFEPDYWVDRNSEWIEFFWEKDFNIE